MGGREETVPGREGKGCHDDSGGVGHDRVDEGEPELGRRRIGLVRGSTYPINRQPRSTPRVYGDGS